MLVTSSSSFLNNVFFNLLQTNFAILATFKLWSASALNLNQCIILYIGRVKPSFLKSCLGVLCRIERQSERKDNFPNRSNSVSKKPKEDVPSRGLIPGKKAGLQRSCSFNSLGVKAAERAEKNHLRQPSGDCSSSRKRAESAERKNTGKMKSLTVATTPTCMK